MNSKTFMRRQIVAAFGLLAMLLASTQALDPAVALAQAVPEPERDASYHRYLKIRSYVKGETPQIHWMADGRRFWYAEDGEGNADIFLIDPVTNSKTRVSDPDALPDYRPRHGEEQTEDSGLPSPDRRWNATVRDNNLWLTAVGEGKAVQMMTDGEDDFGWVIAPNARRLGSFLTGSGGRWSPSGQKLALKRVDARDVGNLSVVRFEGMPVQAESVRFAIAGAPMFQTELFVLDVSSKELVRLDTAKDGDYRFEIVGWRRDESEVLFLRLNRRHTELQLMVADAATGDARVILTETGETFVVGAGKTFHETVMTLLEGSDRFIWMSERDGWNHLYLYGPDGTLIRQLTRGEFPVLRVVDVDEETGWVYFTAHGEERLYDTQVYRVGLDGKGFKRLTEERGQHAVEFSPSHEYLLDTHSSLDRPPSTDMRRADGTLVRRIWQANADSLKTLAWRPPEEFIVKAADGKTNLYGILYTPSHFDPTEKYPVVDAIYAGPTECLVSDLSRFTSWPYLQALAEQGFVVFVVDGRGTPERSKAFQDVVYGNYGRNEIPDHVAALRQLAERRPYMDTDRVGIFGGSSGGYFTIRAMLTAPDVYDVGVADSPDVDFMHEDHFAFEPYMGLPQDNSDGYEYGSNVRIAGNLRGKLMLMVGTDDFGAYPGTMAMVAALIRESKPYDLVILPNQPHNYSGASGVYAREANTRYLKEHLLP